MGGWEFAVEEEDENEVEDLVLGPQTVYYSVQDVEELKQEWQAVHCQELLNVQEWMQVQLDGVLARSRRQENLGSTQPRLSATAPPFVPQPQLATNVQDPYFQGTTGNRNVTQPMGSDIRSTTRMAPVDVYAAFQKEGTRPPQSYGDHRIADPMARTGPEE